MAKKDYFVDSEDEEMYLELLDTLDLETATNMFNKIKNETVGTHLSASARNKTFDEFTYKNLRYLILGCKYCGAEIRVKALATFIYKASLDVPMNSLVDNTHLKKILFDNLQQKLPQIYQWSNVKYDLEE